MQFIKRLVKDERGQTLAEYGLLVALIAVVAIGATQLLGTNITAQFTTLANAI